MKESNEQSNGAELFSFTYKKLKEKGMRDENYLRTYFSMSNRWITLRKEATPVGGGLFLEYSVNIDLKRFGEKRVLAEMPNDLSNWNEIDWNKMLSDLKAGEFRIYAGDVLHGGARNDVGFTFSDYTSGRGYKIRNVTGENSLFKKSFPWQRKLNMRDPKFYIDKVIGAYFGKLLD